MPLFYTALQSPRFEGTHTYTLTMFILPPTPRYPTYASGVLLNGTRGELQATIEAVNSLSALGPDLSFTVPDGTYEAKDCLFIATPMPHPSDPPPLVVNPLAPTASQPSTYSSGVRLSVYSSRYDPPPGGVEHALQHAKGAEVRSTTTQSALAGVPPAVPAGKGSAASSAGSLPSQVRQPRPAPAGQSKAAAWTSSLFASKEGARRMSTPLSEDAQSDDATAASLQSMAKVKSIEEEPVSPTAAAAPKMESALVQTSAALGNQSVTLPPDSIGGMLGPLALAIPIEAAKESKRKKPKTSLTKNNSSFMSRTIVAENLPKKLMERGSDEYFLWANIGRSFNWFDVSDSAATAGTKKEPLSKILFTRCHPLCHDVNQYTRAANNIDIILGMSSGDAVWMDAVSNRYNRINKNGDIIRSAITDIKWVPGSPNYFVTIHSNGSLIIFDKDKEDGGFARDGGLNHQDLRSTETFRIVKSLYGPSPASDGNKHNPVAMYKLSNRPLTSVVFSPDRQTVVVTSSDGFMRFLNLATEVVTDIFPSYYDGILCAAFSPDGKYLVTGGQDDLVSIWSMKRRTIIARGYGHQSWVRKVAFDNWNCDGFTYRVGSVGEDGNFILWDFAPKQLARPKTARGGAGAGGAGVGGFGVGAGAGFGRGGDPWVEDGAAVSHRRTLSATHSVAGSSRRGTDGGDKSNGDASATTTNPTTTTAASQLQQQQFDPFKTVLHPFVPHAGTPMLQPIMVKAILQTTPPASSDGDAASGGAAGTGTSGGSSGGGGPTSPGPGAGPGGPTGPGATMGESESLSDIVFLGKVVVVAGKDGRVWTWKRPEKGGLQ